MNKILVAMAVGAGLFLSGCATVGARQASGPRVVATFDEHGMTGQNVSLVRDASSIKGQAYGRAVSIEWSGTNVKGTYRELPVKLVVAPAGEAMRVDGEFYGEAAAFQYAPKLLEGLLSGCAFHLESSGGHFDGYRSCPGKKTEALEIAVPVQLAQRSEAERAAWLALLLTDETVEVPFVRAQVVVGVQSLNRFRPGTGCRGQGP